MCVITDAGVFLVRTIGAVAEVKREASEHGLGIGTGLNLYDDREIITFGKGAVRHQYVALLGKFEIGGSTAVAACDGDDLIADRGRFGVVGERSNLHFVIR